uniref:Uncharacterized protein n=1 Tax=Bactrocera dorsalis TaxID=27457 RepID=A0A034WYQ8_BACDO
MSAREKCAGMWEQGAEVKLNSKHKKRHETAKQIKINRLSLKSVSASKHLCGSVCVQQRCVTNACISEVVAIRAEAQQHMLLQQRAIGHLMQMKAINHRR